MWQSHIFTFMLELPERSLQIDDGASLSGHLSSIRYCLLIICINYIIISYGIDCLLWIQVTYFWIIRDVHVFDFVFVSFVLLLHEMLVSYSLVRCGFGRKTLLLMVVMDPVLSDRALLARCRLLLLGLCLWLRLRFHGAWAGWRAARVLIVTGPSSKDSRLLVK